METFEELLARWRRAEACGDVQVLDTLLEADFRGDGPLGYVLGKPQWLDRYRTGDLVTDFFEWTLTEIRVHHRTAVGAGVQTQVARYRGRDFSGTFASTVVAIRDGGGWSIVNVQLGRRE
jgi:uncharacterized protein DUF4440